MPPPLFILFIPGVALFFLIQMVVCHAYHFQITLAREKSKGPPKIEMSSGDDEKDKNQQSRRDGGNQQRPQGRRDQNPYNKSDQTPQHEAGQDGEDNNSDNRRSRDSKDSKKMKPKERVRFSRDSQNENENPDRPGVALNSPSRTDCEEFVELHEEEEEEFRPRDARSRRKSVFNESYDPSKDNDDVKVVHPKTPDEKKWLQSSLQKNTIFQHLANDQLVTVVDAMFKNPVTEGEYITKEGDKGNTFYVIQEGVFDVFVRQDDGTEQLVSTYEHEGSFGELALLYNQPRAASVVARSDGVLWAVDGQTFRRIVYKITHQKRIMYESLINNVPMLKPLEPYERANLVDALIPMSFQQGDQIVKQGDEADGMYFIVSGGVRVIFHNANNQPILLNELSNSDYFGELALVADQPRAASAYAVGSTHLAFLDREAFERLLGPCMEVMRRKIDDYNERLAEIMVERQL